MSTGSPSIAIGVVDTGIDYTHPDLVANMWSAPTPFSVTIAGVVISCAAGTHGFNAVTNTCNPMDDHNHGTHVAGTIGARGHNGAGVVGVSWGSRLVAAKFMANGSGTTANAVKAIDFLIQLKQRFGAAANIRVLSNSWGGGGYSQTLFDAINAANAANMLFVASAGNSGQNTDTIPHYPSGYAAPNVVSVAATDGVDAKASFSNYGATSVDLGAPGVAIVSTTRNNTYSSSSGTSMAAPHVSGAAALVLSKCALSTAALKANLLGHVTPRASLSGITVTGGRLNVDAAIRSCAVSPPPPGVSKPYTWIDTPINNQTVSGQFTLAGWAVDLAAPTGTGVDAIHVYGFKVGTTTKVGPGVPTIVSRPGVGAAFGAARFSQSGYVLNLSLFPGTWDIVVYARSTVTHLWNSKKVRITVQ